LTLYEDSSFEFGLIEPKLGAVIKEQSKDLSRGQITE
jgi:hypothetical protein